MNIYWHTLHVICLSAALSNFFLMEENEWILFHNANQNIIIFFVLFQQGSVTVKFVTTCYQALSHMLRYQ